MKTAQLLQTLNDQLSELAALVAPLAEHATLSPRFDRQLFHTRSTLMQAYLAEAHTTLTSSARPSSASSCRKWSGLPSVWRHKSPRCAVKPPPGPCASWDHASPTLSRWQRRRLQHQEYERRLLAMRDQRQRQLAQATSLDEQQRLGKEVEAYSGRLARCRQALDKIETYWRG
ncbi:primosomal replication protein N'' [Klebsiella pneumoniae]|uniref:Primosomal replication protein N n=1 Tax=Klebsiella pneumoniae TaxID=573 RepID=A0A2X1RK65_KLEPN|nr:primosomal replication protein N'' [Klebsiella pneumoniae]